MTQRKSVLLGRGRYEQFLRAAGALAWWPLRATAGTVAKNMLYNPANTPGPELRADPGFEAWTSPTNLTSWTEFVQGSTTVNQDTAEQRSGASCVRLDVDGSNSGFGVFQNTLNGLTPGTIAAGDTIRLSVWAKRGAAAVAKSIRQLAGNNGGAIHILTADWNQYVDDIVNDGASNSALQMYRSSGADTAIYFDDANAAKIGELDALIAGTTSLGQTGLRGANEAFLFDGSTSLMTVYNRASIQGLANFTLVLLFRPTSAGEGDAGVLFSKADEFDVRFNSSSRDLIATVHCADTDAQRVTSTVLATNTWQTVALRYVDATKTVSIFVNGVEASYASTQTGEGARVSNTNNLIIGNNVGVTGTLAGLVDEGVLFPVGLTGGHIAIVDRLMRAA